MNDWPTEESNRHMAALDRRDEAQRAGDNALTLSRLKTALESRVDLLRERDAQQGRFNVITSANSLEYGKRLARMDEIEFLENVIRSI